MSDTDEPVTGARKETSKTVLASAQAYGIAHLLTLLQPDSSQARRQATEFPGILHFDEIMPHYPHQDRPHA